MMAEEERNFRSYYYSKVGFPGVEEKKRLETLFKEDEVDCIKLSQFCMRFSLPAVFRLTVWKILLKVLPRFQTNHEFVEKLNREAFEQAQVAIFVMRMASLKSAAPVRFLKINILADDNLNFNNHVEQENETNSQHYIAIANIFCALCDSDDEAYWLSRNFYLYFKKSFDQTPNLIECTETVLSKEDAELYTYLHKIYVLPDPLLLPWFRRCFAGVLPESALVRVWDRVIGGSVRILPYVAVALLMGLRYQLLSARDMNQVLSAINNISEEIAEVVVTTAIDLCQKNSGQVGITKS